MYTDHQPQYTYPSNEEKMRLADLYYKKHRRPLDDAWRDFWRNSDPNVDMFERLHNFWKNIKEDLKE